MEQKLKKAIEEITYSNDQFPEEQFRIILENREQAIPYLRAGIEKAIKEQEELEEDYQLYFYALFFLGQFQEKSCFPLIMQLATLESETLDFLIGDAITENLPDILYNTYNGDLESLKESIKNPDVDDYAKSGMLRVMGQLYQDGNLAKEELQELIRQIVNEEEDIGDYIYSEIVEIICYCHFFDLLPELWKLYDSERADPFVNGGYEECIDRIFKYEERRFCAETVDIGMMRGWAMFKQENQKKLTKKELQEFERIIKAHTSAQHSKKIGRNDLCPCGSGKKYKKCCLNKQDTDGLIESEAERDRCLKDYPPAAKEREEGRVYLEDLYDAESIEIDKLLYLALMDRNQIQNTQFAEMAVKRTGRYLEEAFSMFQKKKEKENCRTFQDYDSKFSIHFHCKNWLGDYLSLLEENRQWEAFKKLADCYCEMEQNSSDGQKS